MQNINELLDYLPGVDIRTRGSNGAQADISMRGGTFDQVLILLNGVNITDPRTVHAGRLQRPGEAVTALDEPEVVAEAVVDHKPQPLRVVRIVWP